MSWNLLLLLQSFEKKTKKKISKNIDEILGISGLCNIRIPLLPKLYQPPFQLLGPPEQGTSPRVILAFSTLYKLIFHPHIGWCSKEKIWFVVCRSCYFIYLCSHYKIHCGLCKTRCKKCRSSCACSQTW